MKIIPKLWDYTSLLWEHRYGTETESRVLEALKQQISTEYEEYEKDPSIIPRHLSSLFNE
jgi:hypothetical protein